MLWIPSCFVALWGNQSRLRGSSDASTLYLEKTRKITSNWHISSLCWYHTSISTLWDERVSVLSVTSTGRRRRVLLLLHRTALYWIDCKVQLDSLLLSINHEGTRLGIATMSWCVSPSFFRGSTIGWRQLVSMFPLQHRNKAAGQDQIWRHHLLSLNHVYIHPVSSSSLWATVKEKHQMSNIEGSKMAQDNETLSAKKDNFQLCAQNTVTR